MRGRCTSLGLTGVISVVVLDEKINGKFFYKSRSPIWLDTAHNTNGKTLEDALPQINGFLVNNDGPIRIADRVADSDSCIDLTIVTHEILTEVGWKLLPLMGSDHRPTLTNIKLGRKGEQKRGITRFRYNTRKRNVINNARRAVKSAKSGRTIKRTERSKPKWLSGGIEELLNVKMEASKKYTEAKKQKMGEVEIARRKAENYKATAAYQTATEKNRQDIWDRFCTECDPSDPTVPGNW